MVRVLLLDSLVSKPGLWFLFFNISKENSFRLKDYISPEWVIFILFN